MFEAPATDAVQHGRLKFHAATVQRVREAVAAHDIVVVGMGWNPFVRWARRALANQGHEVHYIEIGNYASRWRERLAIKLWTGWPLFPQVFVKGTFVGGNARLRKALEDGTFAKLMSGPRAWPTVAAAAPDQAARA